MAETQKVFTPIEDGDLAEVERLVRRDKGLVEVRRTQSGKEGQTPLQVAAMGGSLDIVRFLIEKGAEVYALAAWTYPAVEHAHWAKQSDVVDFFLGDVADKALGTNGLGIEINLAARNGWAEIVAKHIERDPLSVHRRRVLGDTPLHWSAHNGDAAIVRMLLEAGADAEADDTVLYGGKPLHWASEHEPETVRVLLDHGADPNSRNVLPGDFEGFTPLIMCASQQNDCAECAEALLHAGADPSAKDAKGRTALDVATEGGHGRVEAAIRAHVGA
ncbi:hypothetical protein HN371_02370 [Candidatus Poribacteria bacterium]|jgi:ankyrin repeat protein|nr:hypothetical protein [Candidatus Poribacteria bacterium]MBT5537013.1 hypothetical protein [Candidatus Poribacteria bacterium]MBT5711318.1 hypothetical protein [Candidatus Poribacteria bacterium]MBT7100322.1 hypothetical protein [Candidatus Poribacteria bacterium]MBT7804993.1 hypothetical protein [Candidatus Poribacteria bacterium]